MWVKMEKLAEGVDGDDHARRHVPAVEDDAVDFKHGLPGEPRQLTEQSAVEAEEDPQPLGDREHELAVGDGGAQVSGDVLGHDQRPLLVATGAEAASAAGEGDEELVSAPRATHPRETLAQVAAGEELLDGPGDDGPPEAVALLIAFVINLLKLLEVPVEQSVQRRRPRPGRRRGGVA
jgi:hypothetical protein